MATKIINGVEYTHETAANSTKYYGRLVGQVYNDSLFPYLWSCLKRGESIENAAWGDSKGNFNNGMILIPIPDEPKKVPWYKFEHINKDALYQFKNYNIIKIQGWNDKYKTLHTLVGSFSFSDFMREVELFSTDNGKTWQNCEVEE